ncbi:uncharacterized protein LOC129724861 isoform X2 [Wyeomyia smithii]|uniref:uncharacterized protein LOC129724861 isoform X2 n=1 Tax=Wyeomyia smithii TaxID=174621 RepID=UPI0024681E51|nr:uncharacterized protein LOC129724861 isoform X2 [Wyeomyia smithii]
MVETLDFKRLLEREGRKEYQLILRRCNEFGFEYVVNRPPQAKICFGSTIEREAVPLQGPAKSSIMRRTMSEPLGENLAPGSHNITYYDNASRPILKSLRCKSRGYGPLSSSTLRFKYDEVSHSPGMGDYDPHKQSPIKPSKKPFGACVPRWHDVAYPAVPGPGTYTAKNRRNIRKHSFGGKIKIIPATITVCKTENFDKCQNCNTTPEVDYWKNFKTDRSLCRRCMELETDEAKYRSKTKSAMFQRLAQLREYKRIRYCSFYHKHDKTTAAIQFVSNRDLKRKFAVENYLSMFE